MIREINYADTEQLEDYLFIDVRSENEFEEATIPGAINVPLFNNEERAEVGTVYKEQGPEKARELGLNIVAPKLPELIGKVKKSLSSKQVPVFFCWRGGMRSKSMAIFYELVYPNVFRLQGGYRAYREFILSEISKLSLTMPVFVLHGMTGVGKTLLLYKLKEMGISIMDLEGLAGHRGSVFGGIGNVKPVNQKTFDSRIYPVLKQIQGADALVIEAESKRIGKITVQDQIMAAKEKGFHIMVEASVPTRVQRIVEEYQPHQYKEFIYESLYKIEQKLPTEVRVSIYDALEINDYHTVTSLLLEYYYDPRYQYSTDQYEGSFYKVNSDDLDHAARKIYRYIENV